MARARESMRMAGAFAISHPGVPAADHGKWWRDMTTQAGWRG